jgi:transposase-like protein
MSNYPRPTTLKRLYQDATGDTRSHQRTIGAAWKRLPDRKRRMIQARIHGKSLSQIALHHQVTPATVSSMIRRALEQMRKAIAGEPRYNRTGRKRRAPAPEAASARPASVSPGELGEPAVQTRAVIEQLQRTGRYDV